MTTTKQAVRPKKNAVIFIKASKEEKAAMNETAARDGLPLTTWLRRLGMRAVHAAAR